MYECVCACVFENKLDELGLVMGLGSYASSERQSVYSTDSNDWAEFRILYNYI